MVFERYNGWAKFLSESVGIGGHMIEAMKENMKDHVVGFMDFVRKQGVMGLAIGFVLGGAVTRVVTALVTDIINPLLAFALGRTEALKDAKLVVDGTAILWGDFLSVMIDFLIIALVIYLAVKILGIEVEKKNSK